MMLAQSVTTELVLSKFTESLTPAHFIAAIVVIIITAYVLVFRKPLVAVFMLVALSLLTSTYSDALSSAAFLGRWYFLVLAAAAALLRASPGAPAPTFFMLAWMAVNFAGLLYTPYLEGGAVRAVYFLMAFPAFFLTMGPAGQTSNELVRLIRGIALLGIPMAVAHAIFVIVFPQRGDFGGRLSSFYLSPQPMSLATANLALAMIWTLLSKNAGKWTALMIGAVAFNVLVILASTQRTALFSLAAAVMVMFLFYRMRGALIGLVVFVGIAALAAPLLGSLVSQRFFQERMYNLDTTGRSYLWGRAIHEGLSAPLLGHGSGAATYWSEVVNGSKFHQAYLAVFYDFGLTGVLVMAGMIIAGITAALRAVMARVGAVSNVAIFALAAIVMCAIQGLVETGLADTANQTAVLFYVALGLAGSVRQMITLHEQRAAAALGPVRPYAGMMPGDFAVAPPAQLLR